ncbi:FUN14 domain-containing protein 1 isoform X1 [Scyliorhinus canicula]|uniref:FUN14 domain-containing protein 1 isoform X1 n=1 Tax=Scyliorhinus canicula TaxID=7830 RepID=UPI0018F5CD94|nr:FUN14 domain-containing protein 1 isoform X1 [Scyliorhinus canicula]
MFFSVEVKPTRNLFFSPQNRKTAKLCSLCCCFFLQSPGFKSSSLLNCYLISYYFPLCCLRALGLGFLNIQQSFVGQNGDGDSYEVVDLLEYSGRHEWWGRIFGQNPGPVAEKYSVATQLMMGGVTGWCAGFVFQKIGKLAATAIGGGFLLMQVANHSGYIKVDWKRVEKDVNKAKRQLRKKANKAAPEINTIIEESAEFVKKNIVLTSGFVGGFLLGLAS